MLTDLEAETLDIEWFGVDSMGQIARFISGGQGFLPASIKNSTFPLNELITYFGAIPPSRPDGISSPLSREQRFASKEYEYRYIAEHLLISKKGLYSYDCEYGDQWPSNYFIVATPSQSLEISNLSDDIATIISRTKFNGTFATHRTLTADLFS